MALNLLDPKSQCISNKSELVFNSPFILQVNIKLNLREILFSFLFSEKKSSGGVNSRFWMGSIRPWTISLCRCLNLRSGGNILLSWEILRTWSYSEDLAKSISYIKTKKIFPSVAGLNCSLYSGYNGPDESPSVTKNLNPIDYFVLHHFNTHNRRMGTKIKNKGRSVPPHRNWYIRI